MFTSVSCGGCRLYCYYFFCFLAGWRMSSLKILNREGLYSLRMAKHCTLCLFCSPLPTIQMFGFPLTSKQLGKLYLRFYFLFSRDFLLSMKTALQIYRCNLLYLMNLYSIVTSSIFSNLLMHQSSIFLCRASRWSSMFFVLYVLLGVYFVTNLILAVVYDSFKGEVYISVFDYMIECDNSSIANSIF